MAATFNSFIHPFIIVLTVPLAIFGGLVFILAVIVGVPAPTHAQTSPDSTVRLTATAVRTEVPPVIDGNLNDVVWETATRLSGFVQQRPLEGAPASEKTEVYIAYDCGKSR